MPNFSLFWIRLLFDFDDDRKPKIFMIDILFIAILQVISPALLLFLLLIANLLLPA